MNKKLKKNNKSQLDGLTLADGKHVDRDIEKVRELEEILAIKNVNPFGTHDIEVFKENLSEMAVVDMQHLCEKIGIFASGSRQELRDKLLRHFKSSARGSISMTIENPSIKLNPNNPNHKNVIKILKEI